MGAGGPLSGTVGGDKKVAKDVRLVGGAEMKKTKIASKGGSRTSVDRGAMDEGDTPCPTC